MSSVVIYLVLAIILASAGNLLLRRGMRSITKDGRPVSLGKTAAHAIRSPSVWAGTLSYATAMGFWLQVLGHAEIGLVYPIFSGGATICVMAAAVTFLGETLERRRILGALLMIAGIFLASIE